MLLTVSESKLTALTDTESVCASRLMTIRPFRAGASAVVFVVSPMASFPGVEVSWPLEVAGSPLFQTVRRNCPLAWMTSVLSWPAQVRAYGAKSGLGDAADADADACVGRTVRAGAFPVGVEVAELPPHAVMVIVVAATATTIRAFRKDAPCSR
jgi:hypothetical protein